MQHTTLYCDTTENTCIIYSGKILIKIYSSSQADMHEKAISSAKQYCNIIIRMQVAQHKVPKTKQIIIGTDLKQHISLNKEGCVSIICNSISINDTTPDLALGSWKPKR